MTDNDIIKALECCGAESDCENCPYFKNKHHTCGKRFNTDVLKLINRQKAEIERLNNCVKSEDEVREIAKRTMEPLVRKITREQIDNAVKLAKAEAYKEFAERLKEYLDDFYHTDEDALLDTADAIDNLVKEMVGEENGEI